MHCNVVANHIYYYQTTTKYIFGHIAINAFSKNWIGRWGHGKETECRIKYVLIFRLINKKCCMNMHCGDMGDSCMVASPNLLFFCQITKIAFFPHFTYHLFHIFPLRSKYNQLTQSALF